MLTDHGKLPEVPWEGGVLTFGRRYRIIGQFHTQEAPGAPLAATLQYVVDAIYEGQLTGNPDRHVFMCTAGTRYVVSSPAHTWGMTAARVYRHPQKRARP
jgi:hypothetical protein